MEQPKMTIEDLQWLQSVQQMAYRLYAINRFPDDDYHALDDVIDNILSNNGVNTDDDSNPL